MHQIRLDSIDSERWAPSHLRQGFHKYEIDFPQDAVWKTVHSLLQQGPNKVTRGTMAMAMIRPGRRDIEVLVKAYRPQGVRQTWSHGPSRLGTHG